MVRVAEADAKIRREYARLLRRYLCGDITNDQYEDFYDALPSEPVVSDIHNGIVWYTFSDLKEHRANTLDRESRRLFARLILFLRTDMDAGEQPPPTIPQRLHRLVVLAGIFSWIAGAAVVAIGIWRADWTIVALGASLFYWLHAYLYAAWLFRRIRGAKPLDRSASYMAKVWPFKDASAFERVRLHGSGFLGSRQPLGLDV